jgi:uncharacterized membrane protein YfcA
MRLHWRDKATSVALTTLGVIGIAIAFPAYELLGLARENPIELILLILACILLAILGTAVGERVMVPKLRTLKGPTPYVLGGVVGIVGGGLGIAAWAWSVWFLVVLAFLFAALVSATGIANRVREAAHG